MDNTCGEPNAEGEPCGRQAGWGTPSDIGPCKDHAQEYRVPRKLTEEARSKILGAAQRGAFKQTCAAIAGVTPQTLRNWLNQGEQHVQDGLDTPLSEFYLAFQRAHAQGEVSTLQDCSSEFLAERAYGYTKTQELQHTGSGGGPLEIAINEEIVETPYSEE